TQRIRPDGSPLRENGVYLFVGGLGRIGLELARHVAERVRANLVLVSLSGLPTRDCWEKLLSGPDGALKQKIQRVQALEQSGSQVTIMSADSCNVDQMKEVVAEVDRRYSRLDGVFHSAGLKVDNTLQGISREECERQLRPKLEGLPVLEKVLDRNKLDFVLVVSWLASVLGVLGYPAYAAAHAFADSFTYSHNRSSPTHWTCVNFDNWISAEDDPLQTFAKRMTFGMSFEEGSEVMDRLLGSIGSATQTLVSTGNLQARIENWLIPRAQAKQSGPLVRDSALQVHARPHLQNAFVPPRSQVEQDLAGIWQQLLGIESIGVEDNFFELGGDSVISLQVVSRCRLAGLELSPNQVLEHQTIAELAALVGKGVHSVADREVKTGPIPLTPIQHWFFGQNFPDPHHFNQAVLLELRRPLAPSALEQALQQLIEHHDSLRVRYRHGERGWESEVGSADPISVRRIDLRGMSEGQRAVAIEAAATEVHAGLNLSESRLLGSALFDFGDSQPAQLLLVVHHLATDLVSWRILIEDLDMLCQQQV